MRREDRALSSATTRRELLRKAGLAGAALAASPLLAACGGGDDGGGSDGQVTIDFWDEIWGGDTYQPTVRRLIAAYERANPNVRIAYRSVPWANFYEVYNTAIASGSAPDVAVAPTFPWRGSLTSLDDVVERWRADGTYDDVITAALEDQRDADGLLTGLPWGIELRVITYRRDVLARAGQDVPRTLEEIGAVARAVSRDGRHGLGFTGETLGSQMLYSFFLNNGGGLFDDACGPAIDSDRNAEVCEWIQALMRDGAIPSAAAGWTPDELNAAMNAGEIAMAHNAPGWFAALEADVVPQVAIMPPPTGWHGDKGTIVYYQPLWTFEGSEHPQEAAAFIEWWLENIPELFRRGQVTSMPARRSFYEQVENYRDPRYQVVLDEWVPIARSLAGDCTPDLLYNLAAVEGRGFLQTLTQDVLTLKPVEASLKTAQDALAEALEGA